MKRKTDLKMVLWRILQVIIVTYNSRSYSPCGVLSKQVEVMPNNRCCVGGCDNDSRYPEKVLKKGHVILGFWYGITSLRTQRKEPFWVKNISKRLEDCEGCEPWFNSFLLRMISPIICCT